MIISGKVSVGGNSIIGNVDKAENIYVKEIEFNNRYEFPSIGKENIMKRMPGVHIGLLIPVCPEKLFREKNRNISSAGMELL